MSEVVQTSAQDQAAPGEAGRPPFEPTPKQRREVAIAKGGGMSHEQIASALGIARGTLEKHFEAELAVGASKRRLEVMGALFKAAKSGNVTAAKAYLSAGDPLNSAPPPVPEPKEKAEKLGKKELAHEEAKTAQAGTDWGELLPGNRLQ